jgi:hypothetical protein
MAHKVWVGEELTNLQVYVGTITQFEAEDGRLTCRDIILVAVDQREAGVLVAAKYPDWELQTLTPLSALPWFEAIVLDPDCPQVTAMREWIMEHIEAVVATDDI